MAASRQVKERTAGINADIESSISGVRVARAFHNEAYEIEKFEKGNARYRTAKRGLLPGDGNFHLRARLPEFYHERRGHRLWRFPHHAGGISTTSI